MTKLLIPKAMNTDKKIRDFLSEKNYIRYGKHRIKLGILYQKKVLDRHYINVYYHCLDPEQHPSLTRRSESFSIEIYFETIKGGHSTCVQVYGLSFNELKEKIDIFEQRLMSSISVLGGHSTHYRRDE